MCTEIQALERLENPQQSQPAPTRTAPTLRRSPCETMDAHTTLTYGVDTALAKIDTVIADARPAREANKLSLDTHGFTLEPQKTTLKTHEFFNSEMGAVERLYYPEMKRAIKKATGCDEVLILEHIVRDAGAADARGTKNPFAGGGNGINGLFHAMLAAQNGYS